ncbi:hypothetical protein DVH24_031977 [Malus domestica]|uniref:Uncharacterized protein n=1 Tax=Malus domestica TaxID=3750 RepID=A0A498J2B9_MALDO|nr:hypothetical protein DVH24_031977 [Malus domestica]
MPLIPISTSEEGGWYKSLLAAHNRIFRLLNILGVLLQVKHATGNLPSPFVTDHNTVVMLIANLLTYAGTLEIAEILQASNNTNIYELMNNISLLCGTLALVLLVLLLVPAFGWFTFACWAVYFVIIGTKSYQTLKTVCIDAAPYVRDKMKEVMRFSGSEEPQNQNGDASEAGQYKSLPAVHKYMFFLLAMLGALLQVKQATGDLKSPFVTYHNTVVMLIANLLTYAGTLETAEILQASNNTNIYELMNNISLLCGTLASVLLVLLLVPTFGWFTLACWALYFVIIVTKSYQTLKTLYVGDKMKGLMMTLRGTEEPQNQRGMP